MILSRGEAVVFDTLMSFVPAEETRVSLEVPAQSEDEDLGLEFTLLNGEQPIFRGAGSVSLTRGGVTPVALTLDPVPSEVELDRTVNLLGVGDPQKHLLLPVGGLRTDRDGMVRIAWDETGGCG